MSHSVNRLDIAFLAGFDQVNQPVFENLTVELLNADTEEVRLLKSPLLTRNLAAGDKIRPTNPERGEYDLIERSGNLSIRVFCRGELDSLANTLTPEIEKLGGSLDLQTERALVYTIHCSIGFKQIEEIFNDACDAFDESMWLYGNVYDDKDGKTPLGWWTDQQEI